MMMMMMMNIHIYVVGEVNYFEFSWMSLTLRVAKGEILGGFAASPPGMEDYIRTELVLNPSSVAREE